jgi:hypothetical protein
MKILTYSERGLVNSVIYSTAATCRQTLMNGRMDKETRQAQQVLESRASPQTRDYWAGP